MYGRLLFPLLLILGALIAAPRMVTAHAASVVQLPLCSRPLPATARGPFPTVMHVGAHPVAVAVSEATGHSFVALAGQTGAIGAAMPGCRSSVTTIDTASEHFVRRVPLHLVPTSMAVDDLNGRIFVAGYDEDSTPTHTIPAMTVLNTGGKVIRAATSFSQCPCANSATGMLSVASDGAIHRLFVITYGSVITFDARTGAHLETVRADVNGAGGIPAFAVDTLQHRVFVATGTGVTVIDGRTGARAQTINLGQSERVLALDSRTHRVFVAEGGCRGGQGGAPAGGVAVLDAVTGDQVAHVLGCGTTLSIQMDGPARRVLVGLGSSTPSRQRYAVLDAASGRVLRTITTQVPLFFARSAVEPNSGRIYFDDGTGSVTVLDPIGWRNAGRIVLSRGTIGFLTIASRAHRLLVTNPYRGTLTIVPTLPPPSG